MGVYSSGTTLQGCLKSVQKVGRLGNLSRLHSDQGWSQSGSHTGFSPPPFSLYKDTLFSQVVHSQLPGSTAGSRSPRPSLWLLLLSSISFLPASQLSQCSLLLSAAHSPTCRPTPALSLALEEQPLWSGQTELRCRQTVLLPARAPRRWRP